MEIPGCLHHNPYKHLVAWRAVPVNRFKHLAQSETDKEYQIKSYIYRYRYSLYVIGLAVRIQIYMVLQRIFAKWNSN